MNKRRVDDLLPAAVDTLKNCKIVNEKNEINKNFRGQISSFGAAVASGSLLAAAAFFNQQGGAKSDRGKLMDAINGLLKSKLGYQTGETLFNTIRNIPQAKQRRLKEDVLACAVALKLAMNLYTLKSDAN